MSTGRLYKCKYTGCIYNGSQQFCKIDRNPVSCERGKNEKRIEVAYEKGIEYGKREMVKTILKVMFPSLGESISDAICDGVDKGQSNEEILHRIAHIRNKEG